jgi:S1-C subfamily serine protease
VAALVGATLIWALPARAGEDAVVKRAHEVVARHKDAIVQVKLVLKMTTYFGGRQAGSNEQKIEVNGTTIDPSGLTVISNMATDPFSMMRSMAVSMAGGGGENQFKQETKVTDVKIVLADGTEYPSKVVLRDKDLDLAFVRPEKKGLKLACVKLKKTPGPKLLENVIGLTRLDRGANREPAVTVGRVLSIIKKPRVRYVTMLLVDSGCPVFDRNGSLLGLSLMRQGAGRSVGSMSLIGFMPSVLPCEDILEVAKQVPPPGKVKEKTGGAGEEKKKGAAKTSEESKKEAKAAKPMELPRRSR